MVTQHEKQQAAKFMAAFLFGSPTPPRPAFRRSGPRPKSAAGEKPRPAFEHCERPIMERRRHRAARRMNLQN